MISSLLKAAGAVLLVATLVLAGGAHETLAMLERPISQSMPAGDLPQPAFEVPPGMGFGQLAGAFFERGYIERPQALRVWGRLSGNAVRIKAGEYRVLPHDSPRRLLARIVRGDTIRYSVTLVEGWTFAQMRKALAAATPMRSELTGLSDDDIMARLGRAGEHPEGWFFPDTYHYHRGDSDLDILRRAHRNMVRRLDAAWAGRAPDLPYTSPYEALIMASIVERESGVAHERPSVAGVFVRRLQRGMLLQTDPTVIYGMGERYDGNIRRRDLREDTPYNTYVHKGLTPTPIANPGAGAIEAALHPAPGTALYFVARADGTGEHTFSDTYEQHKKAVAVYLRNLRKSRGS